MVGEAASANFKPRELGERWFRRLLLAGYVLILAVLAAVAIYLLRQPSPASNIYFDLQRQASLVYLGFWALLALLGGALTLHRRTLFLSFYVVLLILAEGGAHAYFYARGGRLYHPMNSVLLRRFEPHPLLIGIPYPGNYGQVSHDAEHHRTTWNEGKVENPILIFAFGGSTTYDIGNADNATWPSALSRILGKNYAVENLGVPGYTSLENLIQSLFVFRGKRPACAVYYEGWNDLRYSHVKSLGNDYSDFRLISQVGNLAVGHRPGFLENNVLLLRMALSVFAKARQGDQPRGEVSGEKDPGLSRTYVENMRLIAEIDRHFGVKPIFVPQILNYARFTADRSSGWIPLVPDKDVKALMQAMNADLAGVAASTGIRFLDKPLAVDWQDADFVDQGHFSASGAAKFAQAVAPDIAAYCR